MRIGTIEVKRRVWIGLIFAVVATSGWWAWIRTRPAVLTATVNAKQPFVRLARTGNSYVDNILQERMELFDPAPLFFPTEWNYGQRPLPENLHQQPGQVFGSFPEKFSLDEENIKTYGVEPVATPERISDLFTLGNEAPFAGIGRIDGLVEPLVERSAFLEVKELSGGNIIISQSFAGLKLPRLDFAPFDYLVSVSAFGVVGEPILIAGSEWGEQDERVNAFFRTYLVKTFHLGERLNPGSYLVTVGP